jgi:hypothetical protein
VTREVERTARLNVSDGARDAGVSNFVNALAELFAQREAEWLAGVPSLWTPNDELGGRCRLGQSDQPCWGLGYLVQDAHSSDDVVVCAGHHPLLDGAPYLPRRVLS